MTEYVSIVSSPISEKSDRVLLWEGSVVFNSQIVAGKVEKHGKQILIDVSFVNSDRSGEKQSAIFTKANDKNEYLLDFNKPNDNKIILDGSKIIYTNDRGATFNFDKSNNTANIEKFGFKINLPVINNTINVDKCAVFPKIVSVIMKNASNDIGKFIPSNSRIKQ
ncbi:MAG: hypothetical protein Ta2D_13270 [Rickettsiales bacterium]|nr:MAG: hypothetical protein Ta2D_13270 [Rickettsiales bacterium]